MMDCINNYCYDETIIIPNIVLQGKNKTQQRSKNVHASFMYDSNPINFMLHRHRESPT